tara:strand:- start:520 stop:771 length:252 start_codon:yes stop_codon:yes gene_type:complete
LGQIIEQNVYNYHQKRLLMKAIILNASAWMIVPSMNALAKYLSISIYSFKETVDNIPSTIIISTLNWLITVPITVFFAIKYFS